MDIIEITFNEEELEVHGDYTPPSPGKYTLSNGDPGYPDDPAEFDITKITRNGEDKDIFDEFTPREITDIMEMVLEKYED